MWNFYLPSSIIIIILLMLLALEAFIYHTI